MPQDRRDVLRGIGLGATSLAVGVGGVGTVAADDHDDDDGTGPARVRVVHASPDAPDVDVLVDGDPVLTGVSFRTISDYLEVPAGSYTVTITAAGDRSTVAFEGDISVEAETDYTVAAIGELSEDTFEPLILVDHDRTPVEGIAYVRVAHVSPDAPAVDLTLFDGLFSPLKDVSFGEATDYMALPAGEFTAEIRPAGGGDPVAEVDLELESQTAYTVFAQGYLTPDDEPADEPFALDPAVDGENQPEPTARVRVAHASPDAPNVNVSLDGTEVLSRVSFGDVSDYLEVPAGTATARISGAGDTALSVRADLTLEADTDYTVVATGEISEGSFELLPLVDDNEIERGRSRVRVVHASPDAPAVDVTAGNAETTLVDGISFGEASDYLSLRPGRVTVEVRPDSEGNDNPFDAEFDLPLQPNRVYTVFAEGYFSVDDEPVDEQFTLVAAVDAEDH